MNKQITQLFTVAHKMSRSIALVVGGACAQVSRPEGTQIHILCSLWATDLLTQETFLRVTRKKVESLKRIKFPITSAEEFEEKKKLPGAEVQLQKLLFSPKKRAISPNAKILLQEKSFFPILTNRNIYLYLKT